MKLLRLLAPAFLPSLVLLLSACGDLAETVARSPEKDAGSPGASSDDAAVSTPPPPGEDAGTPSPSSATYASRSLAATISGGTAVAFYTFDEAGGFAAEGTLALGSSGCHALAFDAQRNLYVACSAIAGSFGQPSEVFVYASGSWNDAAPLRVMTAPLMGASPLGGVAVDSAGNVYVAAQSIAGDDAGALDSAIVVFGPGSDSAPIRVLQELESPLESVNGIAIDSSDDVWVLCPDASPLREFAAGADGRVEPLLMLASPSLVLPDFGAISIGMAGRIWLTSSNRVAWYSTSPSVTYGGQTNASEPVAIAADDVGNVFVRTGAGQIQAFSGGALTNPTANTPAPEATVFLGDTSVTSAVAVSP